MPSGGSAVNTSGVVAGSVRVVEVLRRSRRVLIMVRELVRVAEVVVRAVVLAMSPTVEKVGSGEAA